MKLQITRPARGNMDRRTPAILGILLISSIVFGILNSIPALEHPDYLIKLAAIRTQVLTAVFFQFAMAAAYAWIAVLFFPILRSYNETLALAYLAFRIIGAAFLFAGIASLSLLLSLSQEFVSAGQIDAEYFRTMGELLRKGRDLMNHAGMILPWMIGGLLLCYCMLKMNLVPGWLSVWGLVASSSTLASTLMFMLGFVRIISPLYLMMNVPTALF